MFFETGIGLLILLEVEKDSLKTKKVNRERETKHLILSVQQKV